MKRTTRDDQKNKRAWHKMIQGLCYTGEQKAWEEKKN